MSVFNGQLGWEVENQKFSDNVFGIAIPTPTFREYHDGICVEFLYIDNDLKKMDSSNRRIYLSEEFSRRGRLNENKDIFFEKDSSKIKNNITREKSLIIDNGVIDIDDNNIALSKNDFAKNILEKTEPFDNIDFSGFKDLFTKLENLINT